MKRRKIISFVFTALLVFTQSILPLSTVGISAVTASEISDAAALSALMGDSDQWGGAFILTADIDLSGQTQTPIGSLTTAFTGSFDGDGHKIEGLGISGSKYLGLFSYVDGGTAATMNGSDPGIDIYGMWLRSGS